MESHLDFPKCNRCDNQDSMFCRWCTQADFFISKQVQVKEIEMQGKNVEKIIRKKPRKKTDLTRRIREEQRNLKCSQDLLEDDKEGEEE